MHKDTIAQRGAVAGGVIAAVACMYFLAPFMLPEVSATPITITHVVLAWIGGIIGHVFWFTLYHLIAWYLMNSHEYYFFRRWFFNID